MPQGRDVSSGHDLPGYFGLEERTAHRFIGDSDSVGASYDRYMRSAVYIIYSYFKLGANIVPFYVVVYADLILGVIYQQISLYGGGGSTRPLTGGLSGHPIDDPRMIGIGGSDPMVTTKSHSIGLGGGRSLPPDASSTLFVEGLPANCTRREVSHIFRPFVGYKEVRLVTKEPRRSGDDPLVLCFVDFASPAHAATAMDALQGYKFDEHDRDLVSLQLQFARYPGASCGCFTEACMFEEVYIDLKNDCNQILESFAMRASLVVRGLAIPLFEFIELNGRCVQGFSKWTRDLVSLKFLSKILRHNCVAGNISVTRRVPRRRNAVVGALHEDEHRTKVTRMSTEPKVTRRGPSASSTFIGGSEASKALQLAS
ncbi:hypothetical protein ACSBR2_025853 [Camellia fascicularis]